MVKKKSENELGDDGTISANDKPGKEEKEPFNFRKSVRSFCKAISVEPYLVLYFFALNFTSIVGNNFMLEKACRAELNYDEDVCLMMINGSNDTLIANITRDASILFSDLNAWKDPLQTAIPALYVLFIGAWSDRTGNRKAVLLLPVIGDFLILVGYMFSVYFMAQWPLWVIGLIETLATLFTGGFVVALMGCYNYIADITTPETRTFRIGVMFLVTQLVSLTLKPISAYVRKLFGYYGVFGISMTLYAIQFSYTCFNITNVKKVTTDDTLWFKVVKFFDPKNVWDTLSILLTSRGKHLVQIVCLISAHMFIVGPSIGEGSITFLYAKNKFQMDLVAFSWFSTWSKIISIIGVTIAMTVFTKMLKFHDAAVGLISIVSNVLSSSVYALAPNTCWYYNAAFLDIFGSSAGAVIRSFATKLVPEENIGKICSLIAFVDSMMPVIYIPLFNKVFTKCLENNFYLGTVYFLGAAMTAPAIIVMGILFVFHKRQERDAVRSPEIKEMHVYDNEAVSHM